MLISVANLPHEGRVFPLHFSREDADGMLGATGAEDVRAVAGLSGEVRAIPSGRDVFVLGTIRSRVEYQCVRCLNTFQEDVAADFHRVYTAVEETEPGEVELRREDLDVEPIEGGSIDLTGIVSEELALALKPYAVCRESCQGLCPECGGDRNLGECRCEGGVADPRFAALKALKNRDGAE